MRKRWNYKGHNKGDLMFEVVKGWKNLMKKKSITLRSKFNLNSNSPCKIHQNISFNISVHMINNPKNRRISWS